MLCVTPAHLNWCSVPPLTRTNRSKVRTEDDTPPLPCRPNSTLSMSLSGMSSGGLCT